MSIATKKSSVSRKQTRGGETLPEPDLAAALDIALELMAIRGPSGGERGVAECIISKLREAGTPAEAICFDDANQKSPFGGEIGNLVFTLPGTLPGPRRLLMAHLDTVPICLGAQPVRKGNWVRSAAKTGLGADDRAGAAVVLQTALEILRHGHPHPPLVFFWPVQEEVGLYGARYAQLELLGKPRLAFNWDGGPAERIVVGATGAFRLAIDIEGVASHAGAHPEQGISAIAIASLAIAELVQGGWHGKIHKGRHTGTSNVGVIKGGEATNVVTDRVEIKVEARSHDPVFRRRIAERIEKAFRDAAKSVRNDGGECGRVKISRRMDYESMRLPDDEPCVLAAQAAVRSIRAEPLLAISNGGLDANWMTARGVPTVTLGCGQVDVHTISERLDVRAFHKACRVALRLALGVE